MSDNVSLSDEMVGSAHHKSKGWENPAQYADNHLLSTAMFTEVLPSILQFLGSAFHSKSGKALIGSPTSLTMSAAMTKTGTYLKSALLP